MQQLLQLAPPQGHLVEDAAALRQPALTLMIGVEYGIDKFSQYDDESGHEEAGGDMYWFPIGSECKKHVPAEFVLEA